MIVTEQEYLTVCQGYKQQLNLYARHEQEIAEQLKTLRELRDVDNKQIYALKEELVALTKAYAQLKKSKSK